MWLGILFSVRFNNSHQPIGVTCPYSSCPFLCTFVFVHDATKTWGLYLLGPTVNEKKLKITTISEGLHCILLLRISITSYCLYLASLLPLPQPLPQHLSLYTCNARLQGVPEVGAWWVMVVGTTTTVAFAAETRASSYNQRVYKMSFVTQ